jgi:hypothetical protein
VSLKQVVSSRVLGSVESVPLDGHSCIRAICINKTISLTINSFCSTFCSSRTR